MTHLLASYFCSRGFKCPLQSATRPVVADRLSGSGRTYLTRHSRYGDLALREWHSHHGNAPPANRWTASVHRLPGDTSQQSVGLKHRHQSLSKTPPCSSLTPWMKRKFQANRNLLRANFVGRYNSVSRSNPWYIFDLVEPHKSRRKVWRPVTVNARPSPW